jgi:iron-sulfur cluster assembly protein
MIEITSTAAERIRAALCETPGEGLALRVAARRDRDGRIEYGMGFDERREQDEEVVTDAGITLLVSPPSLEVLNDAVIDFVEIEPGDHRFIFYRRGDIPARDGTA